MEQVYNDITNIDPASNTGVSMYLLYLDVVLTNTKWVMPTDEVLEEIARSSPLEGGLRSVVLAHINESTYTTINPILTVTDIAVGQHPNGNAVLTGVVSPIGTWSDILEPCAVDGLLHLAVRVRCFMSVIEGIAHYVLKDLIALDADDDPQGLKDDHELE